MRWKYPGVEQVVRTNFSCTLVMKERLKENVRGWNGKALEGQSVFGLSESFPVKWILLLLIIWGTVLPLRPWAGRQGPGCQKISHGQISLYSLVSTELYTFCSHPPIWGWFVWRPLLYNIWNTDWRWLGKCLGTIHCWKGCMSWEDPRGGFLARAILYFC